MHELQTQSTDNSNSEVNTALSQFEILTEDDWQGFRINFEKINPGFIKKLKLKSLSLRLNLNNFKT